MLKEFVRENREEIAVRCRARVAQRMAPRATQLELEHGIPMFLRELEQTLNSELNHEVAVATIAGQHGGELLRGGFTIAQVVHDYGDACQAITELAIERHAPISIDEFRALNRCLDNAIAAAVTAYDRQRELDVVADDTQRSNDRLSVLVHELHSLLGDAVVAFDVLRAGTVGIRGSTGDVLGRNLIGLRTLVSAALAEVRLTAGITKPERIAVAAFVDELEVSAALGASERHIRLVVSKVEPELAVDADREILASVISNLLQNAFKFTRPFSRVRLDVHAEMDRVRFTVEDQCGGLPLGKPEHRFGPLEQRDDNLTVLGLGLTMCVRGITALHGAIHVYNDPGHGCVFTVDLPRAVA